MSPASSYIVALYMLVFVSVFSPYISSWLFFFHKVPFGALLRDVLFFGLVGLSFLKLMMGLPRKNGMASLVIASFFFMLYLCVLALFAPSFVAGLVGMRNICYSLVGGLSFSYLFYRLPEKERAVDGALLVLALLVGAMGVADFFTDGESNTFLGFNPEYLPTFDTIGDLVRTHLGFTRANGGLGDALTYGYLSGLLSIWALFVASRRGGAFGLRLLGWGTFLLCGLGCMLSMTRGAIVAYVAAGSVFSLFRFGVKSLIAGGALAAVLLTVLTTLGLDKILSDRFTGDDAGSAYSTEVRVDSFHRALSILGSNPILGAGLGTQGAGQQFSAEDTRVATDNSVMWISLEVGVVGVIFYAALFFWTALVGWTCSGRDRHYGQFVLALMIYGSICAALSSGLMSPTFIIPFFVILTLESRTTAHRNAIAAKQPVYA